METTTTQGAAPSPQTAEAPAVQNAEPSSQPSAAEANETANKLLAGKFKSQGDLEKSYQEAQKELTKTKQELAALKKNSAAQPAPENDGAISEQPVAKPDQKAEVQFSLMDEYVSGGGKISPESKAKAAQALGLPPSVVDQFEQYLATQVDVGLKKITDHFKDEGSFNVNELIESISKTVPPQKLAAIQTLIDGGDIEVLRPYVKEHVKAKLPAGQVGQVGNGGGGFKSAAERMNAMMDARWSDTAYRDEFWRRNDASPEGIRKERK